MKERLQYLFNNYINKTSTPAEVDELMELVDDPQYKTDIQSILDQVIASGREDYDLSNDTASDILQAIFSIKQKHTAPVVTMKPRRTWTKWIAAAAIIIIVGVAVFNLLTKHPSTTPPTATTNDVQAPKETRAVITLADGSKLYLDSAGNGIIAQQNEVAVVKNANGEITYAMSPAGGGGLNDSPNNKRPGVDYNTLSNPRGSKVISLTLNDGTKVWLNSESSLKYPIAFNGNTRKVEITGEAYFEVKHNSNQPFKVHLPNGSIVEDIGTSFNINAYTDEESIKTTLIEGSVRVSANSDQRSANSQVLKPNQQAVINRVNPKISRTNNHERQNQTNIQRVIEVQTNVDIEEVTAWKNGRFEFAGSDLSSVMRQISRWYDVEVVYEGAKPIANFRGTISRQENVGEVLKMLELTKAVHFKIEGKKITVMR